MTKNPESLNAKLLTNPRIDPFFGKLSCFVGETEKSNRMLTNLLSSKSSKLQISLNERYWNCDDQRDEDNLQDSILVEIPAVNIQNSVVRWSNADHRISEAPFENLVSE